ncbi:MAG: TolC family protein [Rhodothermia bacterium]|nr:MAG: TolC family protein [Rhodothermia bacterium]
MNALTTRRIVTLGRGLLGLLALVVFISITGRAATAQEIQRIGFNDAVRIALERNVTIRRAQNNVELQVTTVAAQRAAFLPNLNFNSGTSRIYGLSFDQTAGKLVNESTENFNMGASSSLNIFNGFADVASLAQARLNLESQEYGYDRTRQTIVFNVITNYLNVILTEERLAIRQEDMAAQEILLNQIEEFVNAGVRAVSDLYTQQATLAASEAQVLTAESQFQVAKTRLIQILQLDPLGDYEFIAPDPDDIPLEVREYDPQNLMVGAFESRSDLRAQEATIDAATQGIRVSKAGYLPKLNFSSSYRTSFSSRSGSFRDGAFVETPFSDQLSDNQSKSLSLSLSIPLFNRLAVKTSVERSRVQYANAMLDLEAMQQSVALDIRQAYYDYQTGVKQLDVTAKQLRAAEQALEVEQERYDVGASTLVELTQSRVRYTSASSGRAQAIFQFHFQRRLLEYYQGILDPGQPLF